MKRALYTATIDMSIGPQFKIAVPDPATCIYVRTIYQPKSLLVTMKQPPLIPVMQMVFLVDPDAPAREHYFLAIPEGMVMTGEGALQYRGVTVDPRTADKVLAIFETGVMMPTDESKCSGDEHAFIAGHEWCECGARHQGANDIAVPPTGEGSS